MSTLDIYFFRKLIEKLEEEKNVYGLALTEGGAQSYEEYTSRVGYLKGLSDAIAWAYEINEKLIGK
jgi:hypothetical protein